MAFYCATMLSIALELAAHDPAYEDVASKFFEHFVSITHAMNTLGGTGLWDEQDGFYYDQIHQGDQIDRLRLRSLVGVLPLCAVEVLPMDTRRNCRASEAHAWFLHNERALASHVSFGMVGGKETALLAMPSRERLLRVLHYLLDEREFLSPFGIRSLSAVHRDRPFVFETAGQEYRVDYTPGESTTSMFGGNSNWRGPVWLPINYLVIEALERYGRFYGDSLQVEYPTGSGNHCTLQAVADDLARRLTLLFRRDAAGQRPFAGGTGGMRRIPIGGSCGCSTSTSTATRGGAAERPIRPAGPR
jgi:hypothetical protein